MSPTPFPTTPLYDRVATDTYCGNGITVPTSSPNTRQLAVPHDRSLQETTPVEACYEACYQYYSPAPNNAQFFFQLVPGEERECQCCKTCQPILALEGALLMEACVPNTLLRLTPKISRKYVKASDTKPVYATYRLRVRKEAKDLRLTDMGVQVTLPAGATVVKTSPSAGHKSGVPVNVSGDTVSFYPFALDKFKLRTFKVKVRLTPPFTDTAGMRFQGEVFQNAYGLAGAPYCLLPASDAVVNVK